ncbi:MAG: sulfatase-like hydrolase/transferase, partial [Planctomycetota bacterium]
MSRLGFRFWAAVLFFVFLPLLCKTATADEPRRPNVVIVLADDLGFSDLGCYGGEIETPELDRLAKDGLQFTQFYNTARCWPTRGALLTGYYPQQIRRDRLEGIPSGNGGKRPAWAKLLPELLRAQGYRSYHSGKWHIDGSPLAGGFDRCYLLDDHDRFFGPKNQSEDGKPLPTPKPEDDYYATTAIADHAIRCLREHRAQHGERPFFSYVASTAPHFPLQAKAEDIARYRERYLAGWDSLREQRWQRMSGLGLPSTSLSPIDRTQGPTYPQKD